MNRHDGTSEMMDIFTLDCSDGFMAAYLSKLT